MSILTINWVRIVSMILILSMFIVIEVQATKQYPYIEGARLSKTEILLWLLWLLLILQPSLLPSLGLDRPPLGVVLLGWLFGGLGIWLYKKTRQQLGSHSANAIIPKTGYLTTGVYAYFRHPMYISFFYLPQALGLLGSLYFMVTPSLALNQTQLRHILYDHLYARQKSTSTYEQMQPKDWQNLEQFYAANQDHVLGIGAKQQEWGVWYPIPQIALS